jgi:hypothetical protein
MPAVQSAHNPRFTYFHEFWFGFNVHSGTNFTGRSPLGPTCDFRSALDGGVELFAEEAEG